MNQQFDFCVQFERTFLEKFNRHAQVLKFNFYLFIYLLKPDFGRTGLLWFFFIILF